jgi:hypothetical protein
MKFKDMIENLSEFFGNVAAKTEMQVKRALDTAEHRIELLIRRVKRKVMKAVFEILFFALSFVLLLAALIIFLGRYFSYDLIFLGAGLLCLYIALMIKIVK